MKNDPAAPWAAIASDARVREAAEEQLAGGGSAIEAAIAGWFAAAGASSHAAFSPLVIATAGGGGGVRFVDGRARQPGIGFDRPVRYRQGETPPAVARAAAPGSIAALAILSAMSGALRMTSLAARGVALAKEAGAKRRARFLSRVADGANLALHERSFLDEIAERVPRIDGGLLGADDLREIRPEHDGGLARVLDSRPARVPTWTENESFAHLSSAAWPRTTLLACDANGGFAAILIEPPASGLPIFDGEIELPLLAEPLTKGVTRTKPGSPLASPSPVALVFENEAPLGLVSSSTRSLDDALIEETHILDSSASIWLPPTLETRASSTSLYAVLRPRSASGRALTRRFDTPTAS